MEKGGCRPPPLRRFLPLHHALLCAHFAPVSPVLTDEHLLLDCYEAAFAKQSSVCASQLAVATILRHSRKSYRPTGKTNAPALRAATCGCRRQTLSAVATAPRLPHVCHAALSFQVQRWMVRSPPRPHVRQTSGATPWYCCRGGSQGQTVGGRARDESSRLWHSWRRC